jgi:predicted small lipoprotein YifL
MDKVKTMKKILTFLLAAIMLFSLCGCSGAPEAGPAPDNTIETEPTDAPETVSAPPEPVPEADPLEGLLSELVNNIQPGSAGCSLRAVSEAVKFIDWGMNAAISEDEIFSLVEIYMGSLSDDDRYMLTEALEALDDSYQQLLSSSRDELLDEAGCGDAECSWGSEPVAAVESLMKAAGIRTEGFNTSPESAGGLESLSEDEKRVYTIVLDDYRSALENRLDAETLMRNEINPEFTNFYEGDPLKDLGYFITDVNSDGVNELLIGALDNPRMVFDMYTMADGGPGLVFQGGYRTCYYVCSDGTIVNSGSSSAATYGYLYCTLSGSMLDVFGSVICSAGDGGSPAWYVSADGDWDISNDQPATEEQAQALIDQYDSEILSFDFIPFETLTA